MWNPLQDRWSEKAGTFSVRLNTDVRFLSHFVIYMSVFSCRKPSFRKRGSTASASCVLLYSTWLSFPLQRKQTKQRPKWHGNNAVRGNQVMFIVLLVTGDENTIPLSNSEKDNMRWRKSLTQSLGEVSLSCNRIWCVSVCKQSWS